MEFPADLNIQQRILRPLARASTPALAVNVSEASALSSPGLGAASVCPITRRLTKRCSVNVYLFFL